MSDIRESFPTLEDRVTKAGVAAAASTEGQTPAAQTGAIGFSFKDSAGNLILPQLDAQGRLLVSIEGQGTRLRAHGDVAGILPAYVSPGVYTGMQIVAQIALTAAKTIGDFAGKVSARKGAYFQLVYSDGGGTSIILDDTIVDSGQYTAPLGMGPTQDTFAIPATASAPKLSILGGNFETVADLHGTISVLQF